MFSINICFSMTGEKIDLANYRASGSLWHALCSVWVGECLAWHECRHEKWCEPGSRTISNLSHLCMSGHARCAAHLDQQGSAIKEVRSACGQALDQHWSRLSKGNGEWIFRGRHNRLKAMDNVFFVPGRQSRKGINRHINTRELEATGDI